MSNQRTAWEQAWAGYVAAADAWEALDLDDPAFEALDPPLERAFSAARANMVATPCPDAEALIRKLAATDPDGIVGRHGAIRRKAVAPSAARIDGDRAQAFREIVALGIMQLEHDA